MSHFVYILECEGNRFYTGYTNTPGNKTGTSTPRNKTGTSRRPTLKRLEGALERIVYEAEEDGYMVARLVPSTPEGA